MIKTQKAKGVMVIDAETNETMEFYAKIVFVNASGFYFPPLNSTSEAHQKEWVMPAELGHNLMDHHFRCRGAKVLKIIYLRSKSQWNLYSKVSKYRQ
jgi:glycerol-3-phosphate dehydrogenase